jgi:hypothetical protein
VEVLVVALLGRPVNERILAIEEMEADLWSVFERNLVELLVVACVLPSTSFFLANFLLQSQPHIPKVLGTGRSKRKAMHSYMVTKLGKLNTCTTKFSYLLYLKTIFDWELLVLFLPSSFNTFEDAMMITAKIVCLFALTTSAVCAGNDVYFPLIEASGVISGDVTALGSFCGGLSSGVILNKSQPSLLTFLEGPTPHVSAQCRVATPRAGSLEYNSLDYASLGYAPMDMAVAVVPSGAGREGNDCLVFGELSQNGTVTVNLVTLGTCRACIIVSTLELLPSNATAISITVVAETIVVVLTNNEFIFLEILPSSRSDIFDGGNTHQLVVLNRTDLGITQQGWQWQSVAAKSDKGVGMFAAARVPVTRITNDAGSTAIQTWLFSLTVVGGGAATHRVSSIDASVLVVGNISHSEVQW